jgi:hypothetical protein
MNDLEIGQVLWLRIRFNNEGTVSNVKHPYLIVDIDEEFETIEVAQMDSLQGKEFKAAMRSNKVVYVDDPSETVITKDSYVQLDNSFQIENFRSLSQYRRVTDKLSGEKLQGVLRAYKMYHEQHHISENKQVFMNKSEIEKLNA